VGLGQVDLWQVDLLLAGSASIRQHHSYNYFYQLMSEQQIESSKENAPELENLEPADDAE